MKHQEYNGYPKVFHYLCREGRADLYQYANLEQRSMFKDVERFYIELEEHGYDVIKSGDGFVFKKALDDMNDVIRREASKNGYDSYEQVCIEEEICRCGKWIFLLRHPYTSERKEVEIEKGRGGKRDGSGRPSQFDKLSGGTAVIRVPKYAKDEIKQMVDWLVENAAAGNDVQSALWSGLYHLGKEAEECSSVSPELSQKMFEQKALLEGLYLKLPRFVFKEK